MSEIDKGAPAPFRLPTGGRIDRDSTLQFVFGDAASPGTRATPWPPRCSPTACTRRAPA